MFYRMDTTTSVPSQDYTGFAVLVVNSYIDRNVKYPPIHGSDADERALKNKLNEVGFFVVSHFRTKYQDYQQLIRNLSYTISRNQFQCLLFIFSGYQDEGRLIFEDGIGLDYRRVFEDITDPLTAWGKIPKIVLVNTYKASRTGVKALFGIKSPPLPLCKSPACLTMQICHAPGAAEKRGTSFQDTFVSKFVEELNISSSPTVSEKYLTSDLSNVLRHVYHSIQTQSQKLNLFVWMDDQLLDSIYLQAPQMRDIGPTPLPEDKPRIPEDKSSLLSPSVSINKIVDGLEDSDWFHGGLTRDQSEDLLQYEGDFLVRQSLSTENFGRFVLCVLYRNLLYQIPLTLTHSGVNIQGEPVFASVRELVEHYLSQSSIIPTHNTYVQIRRPVLSDTRLPPSTPLMQTAHTLTNSAHSWMHGRVSKEHVQHCLKSEGEFLVWETESCFVLSYVYDEEIQSIHASASPEGEITTDLIAGTFDTLDDLVQHLMLHHSYYRGVYLKTPVAFSSYSKQFRNSLTDKSSTNRRPPSLPLISPTPVHTPNSPISPFSFDLNNPQSPLNLIDKSVSLTKQPWFSKNLTSEDASRLLLREGEFLLRTSKTRPGQLTLSVRAGKGIQTFGVFVTEKPTRYTLNPQSSPLFENVVELVDFYIRTAQPLPSSVGPRTFLIQPVNVSTVTSPVKK